MNTKRKYLITFSLIFIIILTGVGAIMIYKHLSTYDTQDPFEKKDISSDTLYKVGITPNSTPDTVIEVWSPEKTDKCSIVLPVEYGKAYEFHFPKGIKKLIVAKVDEDPTASDYGKRFAAEPIRWVSSRPSDEDLAPLMYVPRGEKEYVIIYTGADASLPIGIYEHTIIADADTEDDWYKPTGVGDFLGNSDSFADYSWGSDEIYEHLYEPLRKQYPNYVKREHIGKDESRTYDMYAYIFEPKDYEQTVFLSSGMHANEEEGYFALAYFMKEVASADGDDENLAYLRERVRFIVVPLINVWGVNQTHVLTSANWEIRYNSTGTDLNRDFQNLSQAETQNVAKLLKKYGADVSFGIDFHTTPNDNGSDLFFNFNVGLSNTPTNFRLTNHIYHRMVEDGLISAKRPILTPSDAKCGNLGALNGKYSTSRTLQAYLWNIHGIPPVTVEYMNFTSGISHSKGSADGLSVAVEIYGNFIIQNALHYAK